MLQLIHGSRPEEPNPVVGDGERLALQPVSQGGPVHVCRHVGSAVGTVVCLRKGLCAESAAEVSAEVEASESADQADRGMSTVEYAIGTVVAAAFAAVLYRIVTGDSVVAGLTDLINSALSTSF